MVIEKQTKLRDAMRQIGLLDSAYWASWIVSSVAVNTLAVFAHCHRGAHTVPLLSAERLWNILHSSVDRWMFSCAVLHQFTHTQ